MKLAGTVALSVMLVVALAGNVTVLLTSDVMP